MAWYRTWRGWQSSIVALAVLLTAETGCQRIVRDADLFHPSKPDSAWTVPDDARREMLQVAQDVILVGYRIGEDPTLPSLIYFQGNAEPVLRSIHRLEWLADHQHVNVIAFDYRGYGDSGGVPALHTCAADGCTIVDHEREHQRHAGHEQKLIIYGRSIGGGLAVYVVAHRQADALILESPPASCPEVISFWQTRLPWYLRWFTTLTPEPSLADPALQPITLIPSEHEPLLIMHGDLDTVIPLVNGRHLYEAAGTLDKTFVTILGHGHNHLNIYEDPMASAITQFMAAHR